MADDSTPVPEVTMSQDVPGFVSNAVLMPFINEVSVIPFIVCGVA